MCAKSLYDDLLVYDVVVSDSEIESLASLSNRTNATIREKYEKGQYVMSIVFDRNKSEETILSLTDKEEFKRLSNDFFKKFIKFGGDIGLSDVFTD